MAIKRLDIHRPSAIRPSEYSFVASDYIGPSASSNWGFLARERQALRAHMAKTGGKFANHDHGGSCHICGATAFYIAQFYHAKTNRYIVTGEDCANKLGMGNALAFRKFRDLVKNANKASKGKRIAMETLENLGLSKAWAIFEADYASLEIDMNGRKYVPNEETTVRDIVSRLVKYGTLSDPQIKYLRGLLDRIANRAKIEAERAALYALAKPFPVTNGRVPVEGKILTVKDPDVFSRFPQRKILLESIDGWKAWGSLPSNLSDARRGDRIKFLAVLTPSDRDEKFGFFARPSQAQVLDIVEKQNA